MDDSPSTEELRRIRYLLIWLIVVVAANGLYAPGEYGGMNAAGFPVLLISFIVGILYLVVKVLDGVATDVDADSDS
ncbi:hypothetical protein ACFQL9_13375 [Halobaculum lipolyticum]|uniref:DUF3311 domain-containing protein n=1 Tax=Halobaculum lipolyticum TaxID=3032001 RepID=A0ABD5WFA0_9EURY